MDWPSREWIKEDSKLLSELVGLPVECVDGDVVCQFIMTQNGGYTSRDKLDFGSSFIVDGKIIIQSSGDDNLTYGFLENTNIETIVRTSMSLCPGKPLRSVGRLKKNILRVLHKYEHWLDKKEDHDLITLGLQEFHRQVEKQISQVQIMIDDLSIPLNLLIDIKGTAAPSHNRISSIIKEKGRDAVDLYRELGRQAKLSQKEW